MISWLLGQPYQFILFSLVITIALHAVFHTHPKVMMNKICLKIKAIYNW